MSDHLVRIPDKPLADLLLGGFPKCCNGAFQLSRGIMKNAVDQTFQGCLSDVMIDGKSLMDLQTLRDIDATYRLSADCEFK